MKQTGSKVAVWLALSCAIHIILFRNRIDTDISVLKRLLFAVAGAALTLPLHEVIHCVFMKAVGLKGVRISFGRDPLGIPSLRSVYSGEVHGIKRSVVYLSPFVLLTLVPDMVFLLSGKAHFLLFIVAMCNAAGCFFDISDCCTPTD